MASEEEEFAAAVASISSEMLRGRALFAWNTPARLPPRT